MQNFMNTAAQSMSGGAGGDGQKPPDDVPWWMKYAGRGLGTGGGVFAIFMGAWACVTLSPSCLIAGIWLILAGFVVATIESPCCFMFIDHVQRFSTWMDNRPYWNKGALYIVLSLPSILLCFGISTFLGSAFIFAAGVVYGMMSIGKKASAEEMRYNLQRNDNYDISLVDNNKEPIPSSNPVPSPPNEPPAYNP